MWSQFNNTDNYTIAIFSFYNKMNKTGELEWSTVVTAIIIIILLITLVIFFRQQITDLAKSFKSIIEGTTESTKDLDVGKLVGEKTDSGSSKS